MCPLISNLGCSRLVYSNSSHWPSLCAQPPSSSHWSHETACCVPYIFSILLFSRFVSSNECVMYCDTGSSREGCTVGLWARPSSMMSPCSQIELGGEYFCTVFDFFCHCSQLKSSSGHPAQGIGYVLLHLQYCTVHPSSDNSGRFPRSTSFDSNVLEGYVLRILLHVTSHLASL